ncbi:PAP-associated domain-containing protein 5, partial [Stegodyphus mimosarum]
MVVLGEWRNLPLSTLSKALESNGVKSSDISIIANATVPIVRVFHTPSKIKVDISFNLTNGVKGAKMLKGLMKQYPALPKLVLVLKQYLVQRGLNEVYSGGMSSYCLTLLIVSFLQGYHKPKCEPSSNLGTLLIEFFELYGINFNYEKVSIHFQDGGSYQPKARGTGTLLTVEDPCNQGNDVARGTYLMHLLKMSFQNAFHVLHKAVTDSARRQRSPYSFLQLILKVDDEILREREWRSRSYHSIMSSLSLFSLSDPTIYQSSSSATSSPNYSKKKKMR